MGRRAALWVGGQLALLGPGFSVHCVFGFLEHPLGAPVLAAAAECWIGSLERENKGTLVLDELAVEGVLGWRVLDEVFADAFLAAGLRGS